ncbi:MAG: polysaccharide deacetylase [Desulfobulbaceae bacterium DB1]|nr:MAG: polysaccharide deacetylase [Desulfobulbaceae bacterium DB1]
MLFLFFVAAPSALFAAQKGPGVTVLIYHRFGEARYPTTNVSEERFREQLAYLMMNNYQVIPLADLVSALEHHTPLPEKAVVITIDDAYRSVYEVAWPILQSFGYPFTVFVYAQGVEEKYKGFMTWEQIRELRKAGVDFQDHSYSHSRLVDRPKGLDDAGYRSWIRNDLQKGFDIMTERLGEKPKFFSIPYGLYDTTVLEEAKAMGYAAILSQDPGSVSPETDVMLIPREPILGNDWSTMAHFEEVLERVDMPVTAMEPRPAPRQEKVIRRFGAALLYPERYKQETLGIYVTGLGWHKARIDGNFVFIDNDRPLPQRITRITVSGKEKDSGRLAFRTWMVVD